MKHILTTLSALLLLTAVCFGQNKIDTTKTIKIHYIELVNINQQFDKAEKLIHRLDIPALKRDSIDNYLTQIFGLLNRRAETTYIDTAILKPGKAKTATKN